MFRTVLFFLIVLISSAKNVSSQETENRISAEVDIRLVPVMRSFYSDYDFFNIETKKQSNGNLVSYTHNNFRASYSARINLKSKNEKIIFGFAAKYSKVANYRGGILTSASNGNSLMTENILADYFGVNIRRLKVPVGTKKLSRGFTLGSGLLTGRKSSSLVATSATQLPAKPAPSKLVEYQVNTINSIDLGYKVKLYDFYLNYTLQYPIELGENVSLFVGCEIPLLRLFMFNYTTRFGLSFNDESFFTSFESYQIEEGNQFSANKNFGYAMKKVNSFSFNFGFKYAIK